VVRTEGERLFEATNTPPEPGETLFDQLRNGVMAYLRYDEQHPHGAWAAYMGMGRADPVLRGIEDVDNDRQANRILGRLAEGAGTALSQDLQRNVRATVYGWLAFTFELCRQRVLDSALDADYIADSCAHALLDALARTPGLRLPVEMAPFAEEPAEQP
jgi:hypothetical protein